MSVEPIAAPMATPQVEPLVDPADPDWLRLRQSLWPDTPADEHLEEMAACAGQPRRCGQFIARLPTDRRAVGFAEAALRTDYVNGTDSSPVAFLEGLYVSPEVRRQGISKALVAAVARWARAQGCTELASDTPLDNVTSQRVHERLGLAETERVVYFNMPLGDGHR